MQDPRSPDVGPRALSMDEPVRRAKEQPDLVGIKDGITISPGGASHSRLSGPNDMGADHAADSTVHLAIKCPSLADNGLAESTILSVPSHHSIAQVKQKIERTWPGQPKAEGMRCFKAGRVLTDETLISSIVSPDDCHEPTAVHLVIRPGAWSEPHFESSWRVRNTAHRRPTSPHPAAWSPLPDRPPPRTNLTIPTIPVPHHVSPTASSNEQDRHLASVVEAMDPSQYSAFRSLLSWTYARYVDIYEEEWMKSYGSLVKDPPHQPSMPSLERLAEEMGGSTEEIASAMDKVEKDILLWGPLDKEGNASLDEGPFKYKQVDIHGLPYLLRVERNPQEERLKVLQGRIERLRNIVLQMEKLINYQSLLDRTIPTSTRLAPDTALYAQNRNQVRRVHPVFHRYASLQRHDIVNVVLAMFFLTVKMAILVYVFSRGVSQAKLAMMIGASSFYVLFEGWKLLERRVQSRRRAARRALGRDSPRRRTDGEHDAAGERAAPDGQQPAEIRSPRAPIRHRTHSPFLLEYWIEHLAYWNLAEEDRAMGMRAPEGTRAVPPPPPTGLARMINDYVLLPVLLFTVTLIPELEQRRRRAIEQRDELIRSTARKVEEQERRLREEAEQRQKEAEGEQGRLPEDAATSDGSKPLHARTQLPAASVRVRQPAFLRSEYARRILDQRSTQGRQIDIAQELEAAAVAANEENEAGAAAAEQADMGFL